VNRFQNAKKQLLNGLLLTLLVTTSAQVMAQSQQVNAQGEQTWSANFNDADIQEVIRFMAGATGKTIIIDPKVRGPIKIISSKSLNSKELYELFLAALDVYGFTAVESGNIVRIVANRDARNLAIPIQNSTAERDDLYITQVIPLKNNSAAKLLATLRPLVSQQGHIITYEPSNAIIITETRANVARINELVKQLDRIGVTDTDVVQLRYANASDVVAMISQLEKPDPNRGITTAPPIIVADKRINAVVVSGDDMSRKRIRYLIDDLDRPQMRNANVRVIYLKYAKAEDVAKVLNGMLQNFTQGKTAEAGSPNAQQPSVQADEATNAVLITADVDTMQTMLSVVDSLDIRRAQVLVEAIIVEIEDTDGKELGIEWMFADNNSGFGASTEGSRGLLGNVAGPAITLGDKNASQSDKDSAVTSLASGLGSITGQVYGFSKLGKDFTFVGLLKMLQQKSSTNILSTPNILTTDNNTATFSVGQKVPFKTGSYTSTGTGAGSAITSPFTTYTREEVGIKLEVTPHVNEGDIVVLDITQEVSSISSLDSTDGVITNNREIKTQIFSRDGETVVLGGLIKDDLQTSERRVPVLGSIPVVGNLFRSQSTRKNKTNLLVFIRASIVRDDKMLTGATAEKYHMIREEQLEHRRNRSFMLSGDEVPVVPAWENRFQSLDVPPNQLPAPILEN
jgi:general secretion pathway protein D